jgi:hypothetical protein
VSTTPVVNGYARWDASGSKIIFEKKIAAANITGLQPIATTGKFMDCSDVSEGVSPLATGDIPRWDGTNWKNFKIANLPVSYFDITDCTDVNVSSVAVGDLLRWDGTEWTNFNIDDIPAKSGAMNAMNLAFDYTASTAIPFGTLLPTNAVVLSCTVHVLTAFTGGSAPTIEVGTTVTSDRVMETSDSNLSVQGANVKTVYDLYAGGGSLEILVDPDGSTAGEGVVVIEYTVF